MADSNIASSGIILEAFTEDNSRASYSEDLVSNGLCDHDGEVSSGLPLCKSDQNPTWLFILLCSLLGLVGFPAAAFLVVFVRRPRSNLEMRRVENEDDTWEMQFLDLRVSKVIGMDNVLSSVKDKKDEFLRENGSDKEQVSRCDFPPNFVFGVATSAYQVRDLICAHAWLSMQTHCQFRCFTLFSVALFSRNDYDLVMKWRCEQCLDSWLLLFSSV
ncbi:inactive leucine-rich repeat receptor-like protein kinase [Sesbania bispinosa]|nr:inactive leucine-rich repeat receptor-like protein kinase [Sesbania bispinosa]